MIGKRLRLLREEKDATQAEVAKAIGVTPEAIGMYEHGKREPRGEILAGLADYFGVSVDYLLGRNMVSEGREAYRAEGTRAPNWVRNLPPHLRTKLSDQDWSRTFFRVMDTAALNNLSPEVLEAVIETLVEAKKRDEAAKAALEKNKAKGQD